MPRTQAQRAVSLKTPLGEDKLLVQRFRINEQLGRLFQIELSLASEDDNINADDLIGQSVTITLDLDDTGEKTRHFNGFVTRFGMEDATGQLPEYSMTVEPFIWFLGKTSDCRIWQGEKVPDIVQELIKQYGFNHFKLSLFETYTTREYCVQYRETALNYVSRLMEEEGIYYFFTHADGSHTMVLADSPSSHTNVATLNFQKSPSKKDVDTITEWTTEQTAQTGKYALIDYDFKKPSQNLLTTKNDPRPHSIAKLELMDFPAGYTAADVSPQTVTVRLEEAQLNYRVASGSTNFRGLYAGSVFTLAEHPVDSQNGDWLVTSVSLDAAVDEFSSGTSTETRTHFSCSFKAIPAKTPYRPPRITPEPIISGLQTALVVGPGGEEIYTDQYGRIKVQFYWDRMGKKDANSSCWMRVSQVWAGKNWGVMVIPRIGMEVIVQFTDGDPDHPLVTGCVYNAEQMPPYALPANMTQSGIKSRSSKGGSPANFNEIRMEDKKGSEELYIHAEKDENIVVEHDKTENVGHDETISIGNDRTETVGHDETITVKNNRTETVVKNETLTVMVNRTRNVGSNESITVGSMRTHTVGINEAITIGAAQEITVGAMQSVTVGASQTITVGANQTTDVGANQSNTIGGDQTDAVSGARATAVSKDDTLDVSKKLSISAGEEISIVTGSASITMKKDGTIAISGKDITIEGSGEITIKASKNMTLKGQKILQN